jgi:hypothetical protein
MIEAGMSRNDEAMSRVTLGTRRKKIRLRPELFKKSSFFKHLVR